jgi:16S rRNA (uracil1498-N3)-methyltransferase
MSDRYFCEQPIAGQRVTLAGPEAHHLISVMRARVGDRVVLLDGTGIECDASIASIGRREVQLEVVSRREVSREAAMHLTLAVALPKGDRQRVLVEKAVELGVARLVPIVTQRSVVEVEAGGVERLRRFVIEASKQCGRNRLMEIAPSISWTDLIRNTPIEALRLIAHPQAQEAGGTEYSVLSTQYPVLGTRLSEARDAESSVEPAAASHPLVVCAIGPEGGFTGDEVLLAVEAGWQTISLGPRILRTETASLALATLLLLR